MTHEEQIEAVKRRFNRAFESWQCKEVELNTQITELEKKLNTPAIDEFSYNKLKSENAELRKALEQ